MVSIEESRVSELNAEISANPDCQQEPVSQQIEPGNISAIQSDPDEENRDPNANIRSDILQSPGNRLNDASLTNAQNIPVENPIDYDKIRRINQNLPTPNQDEPVGSTTNPIRIIQQGNQFVTTQNLSDEELKQIIELLTNKSLINSSGRPNAIYNKHTNKRIVFRVTHAKRRRNQPEDPEDPDFNPEMPLEYAQPFPLIRNKRKIKRISRPPKHLTKDYKRFKVEHATTNRKDADSDIGYSDYERGSDESWSPRNSDNESKRPAYNKATRAKSPPRRIREQTPPPVGPRKRKERKISDDDDDFECEYCERSFATRAGCVRHMRAKHDAMPSTLTPGQPKTSRVDGAPRMDAYMEAVRRRDRLKQAIEEASDDDLINFVLPRLAKLVSPWEHILIHSEMGDPPLPHIPSLIVQLMNLFEVATPFLSEHMNKQETSDLPLADKKNDSEVPIVDDDGEPDFSEINTGIDEDAGKDLDDVICQELAAPLTDSPVKSSVIKSEEPSNVDPNNEQVIDPNNEQVLIDAINSINEPESDVLTNQIVNTGEDQVDEPIEMDKENVNKEEDQIIVKIMTDEQSRALGLPLGRYTCSTKDLKETYLPRRYRSVLAEMKARQLSQPPSPPPANDAAAEEILPSSAVIQQQSDADNQSSTEPVTNPTPITEEDISSGRYMFVLNDQNEPCDLVMEADTGKLFHRSTGAQVNLVDDEGRLVTGAVLPEEEMTDKDIDPISILNDSLNIANERAISQEEMDPNPPEDDSDGADDYIDIEALFPGISVSQVSETGYIVEKEDGTRFHVDCGEDGLTYETLQAVLTMEDDVVES